MEVVVMVVVVRKNRFNVVPHEVRFCKKSNFYQMMDSENNQVGSNDSLDNTSVDIGAVASMTSPVPICALFYRNCSPIRVGGVNGITEHHKLNGICSHFNGSLKISAPTNSSGKYKNLLLL